ncbi:hypothetical protein [Corynebacterium mayonis]|uniref:hypothetical protein n=1 Tax=Corynebacterium mayonis TaxID=3062461 RepID=UPI0031404749
MRHFRRRAVGALGAGCLILAGCTSDRPGLPDRPGEKDTVTIAVNPYEPEQVVLAEIFHQVLTALGRNSSVTEAELDSRTSAVDIITTQNANFTFACTGVLLHKLNPGAAVRLAEEHTGQAFASGSDEASVATYDAVVGAFPGTVMTVDPSPAQGCDENTGGVPHLPHNIIPVFSKNMFTRAQVQRINFITRVLNTKDLMEMSEHVRAGDPVNEVVADWLLEYASIDPNVRIEDPEDISQQQAPI